MHIVGRIVYRDQLKRRPNNGAQITQRPSLQAALEPWHKLGRSCTTVWQRAGTFPIGLHCSVDQDVYSSNSTIEL